MDMLDIYLDAVAAQLPRDTADDIIAELRDTLLSQIEEREEALGRPLTDDEREAVLRAMGHPLVVAARYRKGPQMLIGPELFPYWIFAVKAGLLIMAVIFVLTLMLRLSGNPAAAPEAFAQSIGGLFGAGLSVIGAVTLAGAICEHLGLRPGYLDSWRVKDLELLKYGDPARWAAHLGVDLRGKSQPRNQERDHAGTGTGAEASGATRARGMSWASWASSAPPRVKRARSWPGSDALFSLIGGLVVAAWWAGLLHIPGLGQFDVDGGAVTAAPSPIWTTLHLPILVYILAQVAVDAVGVVQPAAIRLRAALQIPVAVAGIALTWAILNAGALFVLGQGGGQAIIGGDTALFSLEALQGMHAIGRSLQGTAAGISVILTWMLGVTLIVLGLTVATNLWRLFGPGRAVHG
ncbi:hypothetical protein NDN01_25120 [Sphingomonas sp. QA11]|uniref:hypothetical protein n=1 Tax=Sphingomonas sp. QA11 TaxID=2950605 RepID=UPI00234B26B5|nr:hypothetical protein [Sphingomonas sp. QA11]WCM27226.1 hypothetical protein NDN01_25120 [Sphingomonas sp. QA11]